MLRLQNKTDGWGRFAESWIHAMHSVSLQGGPQNHEHFVQAPVDVEERGEFHEPGYLAGGEVFSETKAEEQAVTKRQAFERQ